MKRHSRIALALLVASFFATQSCGGNATAAGAPEARDARARTGDSSAAHDEMRRGTPLDDGVRTESHVALSRALIDPDTGDHVRCLSIALTFIGPEGEYLSRLSGLEVLERGSSRILELEQGGIGPRAAGASAPGHTYSIVIAPPEGATWGETLSDDITVDVVRKD